MMDLSRIVKIFSAYKLFWTVCGVLVVIHCFVYWGPITEQEQEISRIQKQYLEARKKAGSARVGSDDDADYMKAENNWDVFVKRLPVMSDVSGTARQFNYLLQKGGGDVSIIKFKPEYSDTLGLWRFAASVTVRGTYAGIKRTLAQLQNAPQLFCIDALSLKRVDGKDSIELRLLVATYCRAGESE